MTTRKLAACWLGLLLSAGLGAALAQAPAAPKAPIKIGVFLPLSGPFTSYGQPTLDGMRLYFDEIGSSVAGREIELVEKDKVNILSGCVVTPILYAAEPYIRENGIPFLISGDCAGVRATMPGK